MPRSVVEAINGIAIDGFNAVAKAVLIEEPGKAFVEVRVVGIACNLLGVELNSRKQLLQCDEASDIAIENPGVFGRTGPERHRLSTETVEPAGLGVACAPSGTPSALVASSASRAS